jgi:hypothetical protein
LNREISKKKNVLEIYFENLEIDQNLEYLKPTLEIKIETVI